MGAPAQHADCLTKPQKGGPYPEPDPEHRNGQQGHLVSAPWCPATSPASGQPCTPGPRWRYWGAIACAGHVGERTAEERPKARPRLVCAGRRMCSTTLRWPWKAGAPLIIATRRRPAFDGPQTGLQSLQLRSAWSPQYRADSKFLELYTSIYTGTLPTQASRGRIWTQAH